MLLRDLKRKRELYRYCLSKHFIEETLIYFIEVYETVLESCC